MPLLFLHHAFRWLHDVGRVARGGPSLIQSCPPPPHLPTACCLTQRYRQRTRGCARWRRRCSPKGSGCVALWCRGAVKLLLRVPGLTSQACGTCYRQMASQMCVQFNTTRRLANHPPTATHHPSHAQLVGHGDGAAWGPPGRLPAPGQYCYESLQMARYERDQHFLAHEVRNFDVRVLVGGHWALW